MFLSGFKNVITVGVCIIFLSGCTLALLDTASRNIFLREDVNLIEKNYAAADYLVGLTLDNLSKNTVIHAKPLMHANISGISSAFGNVVVDQAASRMTQLGYRVQQQDATEPQARSMIKSGAVLSGTYMPNQYSALVSLRLSDVRSGQILGAFDYNIPLNAEIAELLEDKPTISFAP